MELLHEHARVGVTSRDEHGVSKTTARVDPATANYLMLKSQELELFTSQMRTLLANCAAEAEAVAEQFGAITQLYFHDRSLPAFERRPPETPGQAPPS